jgi:hypothetical protein
MFLYEFDRSDQFMHYDGLAFSSSSCFNLETQDTMRMPITVGMERFRLIFVG